MERPCFMFTGFIQSSQEKVELIKKIQNLGGKYLESEVLQPLCTHLISPYPIRSEKFLGSCAAGKWILTPGYIEDSYRKGIWLEEDQYEWKSSKQGPPKSCCPPFAYSAPYRCRLWVQRHRKGMLATWNVALFLSTNVRASICERIITCGGGKVCKTRDLAKSETWKSITHVFVDKDCLKKVKHLSKTFLILHPDYIRNFIFRNTFVNPVDFSAYTYKPNSDGLDLLSREHYYSCEFCKLPPVISDIKQCEISNKSSSKPTLHVEHLKDLHAHLQIEHSLPRLRNNKNNVNNGKRNSVRALSETVAKKQKTFHELFGKEKLDVATRTTQQKNCFSLSINNVKMNVKPSEIAMPAKRKREDEPITKMKQMKIMDCGGRGDKITHTVAHNKNTTLGFQQLKITDCYKNRDLHVRKIQAFENCAVQKRVNMCYLKEHLNSYCGRPHSYHTFCKMKENPSEVQYLPEALSLMLQCYVEECSVSNGLNLLTSVLQSRKVLKPEILGWMLHQSFWIEEDKVNAWKTISFLHSFIRYYPPCNAAVRLYYARMISSIGTREESLWTQLVEMIRTSILLHNQNERGNIEANSVAMLLSVIVYILELDFLYFLKGSKNVMQDFASYTMCPLIVQTIWNSSNVGVINRNISEFLGLLCQLLESSGTNEKLPYLDILQTLLGMIAECCRYSHPLDNPQDCYQNPLTVALVNSLVCTIISTLRNVDVLQQFLSTVKHNWLTMMICDNLLKRDVEKRNQRDGIKCTHLSLRNIASYYMIPPPITPRKFGHHYPLIVSRGIVNQKQTADFNPTELNKTAVTELHINKRNAKGETKLHSACIKNNVNGVRELLSVPGIDVNAPDNLGVTPLHEAAIRGNMDCVKELLQWKNNNGVSPLNISPAAYNGITPLHDAVVNNRLDVVELLLKHGGTKLLYDKMTDGKVAKHLASTKEMKDLLSRYSDTSNCQVDCDTNLPLFFLNAQEAARHTMLVEKLLNSYFTVFDIQHLKNALQMNHKDCSFVNLVKDILKQKFQEEPTMDKLVACCDDLYLCFQDLPKKVDSLHKLVSQVPEQSAAKQINSHIILLKMLLSAHL